MSVCSAAFSRLVISCVLKYLLYTFSADILAIRKATRTAATVPSIVMTYLTKPLQYPVRAVTIRIIITAPSKKYAIFSCLSSGLESYFVYLMQTQKINAVVEVNKVKILRGHCRCCK